MYLIMSIKGTYFYVPVCKSESQKYRLFLYLLVLPREGILVCGPWRLGRAGIGTCTGGEGSKFPPAGGTQRRSDARSVLSTERQGCGPRALPTVRRGWAPGDSEGGESCCSFSPIECGFRSSC